MEFLGVPNGASTTEEGQEDVVINTEDTGEEKDCDENNIYNEVRVESNGTESLGQSNNAAEDLDRRSEPETNEDDSNCTTEMKIPTPDHTPDVPRRKSKLPSDVSVSSNKKSEEKTEAEIVLKKAAEKQMLEKLISMVQDKISLAKKKTSETK